MTWQSRLRAVIVGCGLLGGALPALGGVLLIPAVRWQSYAFRPLAAEATPNYYGYGAGLTFGYSFNQVVDTAIFTSYSPGTLKQAKFLEEDAVLISYGGEVALRLFQTVYVAVRAGEFTYRLLTPTRADEVQGRWRGPGVGFSLGAQRLFAKHSGFQASVDVTYATMSRADAAADEKRKIDAFSLTLAYVFNANDNLFKGGAFRDFIHSFSAF